MHVQSMVVLVQATKDMDGACADTTQGSVPAVSGSLPHTLDWHEHNTTNAQHD